MSTIITPVASPAADLFHWQASIPAIASNAAGSNQAGARLQVDSGSCFILTSYAASTNYDSSAGDFIAVVGASPGAAARVLVTPPFVPNNFEVMIRYNSDQNLMDVPVAQACIAANDYRAGNPLPYPIIFPPLSTFDFDFYNTAPTVLTAIDQSTVIPLQISFALVGYFVNLAYLPQWLKTWPPYAQGAKSGGFWLPKFTAISGFEKLSW